jgi:hypothetical protein
VFFIGCVTSNTRFRLLLRYVVLVLSKQTWCKGHPIVFVPQGRIISPLHRVQLSLYTEYFGECIP